MANNRSPSPPPKKRKIVAEDPQSVGSWTPPTAMVPKRGAPFRQGIADLARGGSEMVFAKLNIPYTKHERKNKGTKDKPRFETVTTRPKVDALGSFSVMQPGQKNWVQGVLMPMGKTSYFDADGKGKAVPSTLTLKTATVESRAMKFLSMDASQYTPKGGIIADKKKPDSEAISGGRYPKTYHEDEHWGGLTMGSFLEEITGSRGLGMNGVGSGMRAMTMASKWTMRSKGAVQDSGFGARMLKAFPQLGKQAMDEDGMGASALFDELNSGKKSRKEVLEHHLGMGGSIYKAEIQARNAAKQRFNDKLEAIRQSNTDPSTLGKWWGEKAKKHDLASLGEHDKTEVMKDLRREYMATKLDKHAIRFMKTPHRLAKDEAKNTLAQQGIDKATDPGQYKQRKHNLAMQAMKSWGFDTAKAEEKRQVKDTFAQSLTKMQNGGTPKKGNWWDTKLQSGTDFNKLSNSERKALKHEYVASRRSK